MSRFGIVQNCLPLNCNGVSVDVKSLSLLEDRPSGPVEPSVCLCVPPSSVAVEQKSKSYHGSGLENNCVAVCGRGACYPLLSAIRGALLRLRQVAPVVGRRAVQRRRWKKPECNSAHCTPHNGQCTPSSSPPRPLLRCYVAAAEACPAVTGDSTGLWGKHAATCVTVTQNFLPRKA